ncbi:hypothetical protein T484DRAFT_1810270 [Baffinella frigidus]|nr:hypothetical protein T484DRAFT_1810270 [Cryptophyta sp. CCMP2293]
MVAFCNRCLAEGCAKASLSRAAYLSAEGEHAANRSQAASSPPPTKMQGIIEDALTAAATQMQGIIEDALTAALAPLGGRGVADASLARASFQALVDLHAARPDVVAGAYGQRLKWLEAFLFCANEGTRELVAVLYGALAVRMPPAELQAVVETLAASAAGGEGLGTGLDTRLGAVAALGHTLARGGEAVPKEARLAALRLLHALVRDKRADVVCVACRALGLAGLEHPLPLAVGEPSKGGVEVTEGEAKKAKLGESEGAGAPAAAGDATGAGGDAAEAAEASALTELTVLGVIERLGSVLSGKERESDAYEAVTPEHAARALGSICVSNRDPVVLSAAAGFLYATAGQLRVDEFHLSVGEALACVAGGRAHVSPKLLSQLKMPAAYELLSQLKMPAAYEDATKDEERAMEEWSRVAREKEGAGMEVDGEDKGVVKEKAMEDVLAHVMEETLLHAKPQVRAAGAPWLLCLLRYGASHPGGVVQAKVPELQQHFTFMLGERSEFVQEVGSRGLGLVYEMCGDDKALLSGAVAAPGKGRERDEQLFEEGTVKIDDKALGDGSLTTYKELCTVATELGQPELIYKFLNLAGHQKAAERLKPHLPELVPKLYRYQFDPNEKVQEAMAGLWSTVAPDPAKALDEYLPNIMAELIPSCGSRLWRASCLVLANLLPRKRFHQMEAQSDPASCLGLANLLPGKRFHQMETHLLDVYRMSLRALDDVKETDTVLTGPVT